MPRDVNSRGQAYPEPEWGSGGAAATLILNLNGSRHAHPGPEWGSAWRRVPRPTSCWSGQEAEPGRRRLRACATAPVVEALLA